MEKDIVIEEKGRGGIVLYQTPDGKTNLDVKLENETVWLTREQMSLLFGRDRTVIGRHIRNCFEEGELDKSLVCAKFAQPKKYGRREGHMQDVDVEFYNLDVIISVGYRVKSKRGTQFRIWANSVLKDYLVKGYAVRNNLLQERYDGLRSLVDTMGKTSPSKARSARFTRPGTVRSCTHQSRRRLQCCSTW